MSTNHAFELDQATASEHPTHLVLIPSYNTGARLFETVTQALCVWRPVWVIIDGSTDGTGEELTRRAETEPGLRIIRLDRNIGKGGAVLHGLRLAREEGFTHALTMDADGQHSADHIATMIVQSQLRPDAVILGVPVFGTCAPLLRVLGRRVSNRLARLVTFGADIDDSLFGFRVYPIVPLLRVFATTPWMRRFDFDPEAAVRLCWLGVPPVNVPSPVRYYSAAEGGVSHFRYLRDNVLLALMYARLLGGSVRRLPKLVARRRRTRAKSYRH